MSSETNHSDLGFANANAQSGLDDEKSVSANSQETRENKLRELVFCVYIVL